MFIVLTDLQLFILYFVRLQIQEVLTGVNYYLH